MFTRHFRIEFNRGILLKNVTEIQENFGGDVRLREMTYGLEDKVGRTQYEGKLRCYFASM